MSRQINFFEEEIETTTAVLPEPTSLIQSEQTAHAEEGSAALPRDDQFEKTYRLQVKRLIEALLFASNEPLTFQKIRDVADQLHPLRPKQLREIIFELQDDYLTQQRGFRLEEISQGYLLRTCEEFSPYIELLYRNKRTEKLSHAAAEVLAIIAYRQPITRPQIEAIRGVDCSGVIMSLLDRELITAVGRMEAPGRPTLYGITHEFLSHFGLKDLKELPPLADNEGKE